MQLKGGASKAEEVDVAPFGFGPSLSRASLLIAGSFFCGSEFQESAF